MRRCGVTLLSPGHRCRGPAADPMAANNGHRPLSFCRSLSSRDTLYAHLAGQRGTAVGLPVAGHRSTREFVDLARPRRKCGRCRLAGAVAHHRQPHRGALPPSKTAGAGDRFCPGQLPLSPNTKRCWTSCATARPKGAQGDLAAIRAMISLTWPTGSVYHARKPWMPPWSTTCKTPGLTAFMPSPWRPRPPQQRPAQAAASS